MNDEKNNGQMNSVSDYAGPPKSRAFQNNLDQNVRVSDIQGAPSPSPMPPKVSQDVQINEDDILEKQDSVSTVQGDEALLKMIMQSEKVEEDKNKSKKKKKKDIKLELNQIDILKEFRNIKKKFAIFVHQNKETFSFLNTIWKVLKVVFYSIGIGFFATCFFIYFSFEPLLRSYLDKRGLDSITFDIVEYSLSEITLKNVKEKNGLFDIKKVKLEYSFADLLSRKIPFIEIDSMNLRINEGNQATNTTQALIKTFWKLGVFDENALFSINSIRLENSKLYVGNKEYQLPVDFSGIGSLATKRQIVFPIFLQNDHIYLKANVNLTFLDGAVQWSLDVVEGSLNIPGLGKQTITGAFGLTVKNTHVTEVSFKGVLADEDYKKDVDLLITPATNKNEYTIKLELFVPKGKTTETYSISFPDVSFSKDLIGFETDSSLYVKLSNLRYGNFGATEIQFFPNGNLKCSIAEGCSYQVSQRTKFSIVLPKYSYQDTDYSVFLPVEVTMEPQKNAVISFKDGRLDIAVSFGQSSFKIRKKVAGSSSEDVLFSFSDFNIKSFIDFEKKTNQFMVVGNINQLKDSNFELKNTHIQMEVLPNGTSLLVKAKHAQLFYSNLFKPVVALDLLIDSNNYFDAVIESKDKQISALVNGYYRPYTSEVSMAIQTQRPIIFTSKSLTPYQISSLFSEDLKNVRGAMSLKGEVHYKGNRSVSGPLKVKFDNVSFMFGNNEVKDLNAVLNLSQLVPFGSIGAQNISVRQLKNTLPFENIHAQLLFDASRKQFNVSALNAVVAGYPLSIEPMWYNYNAPIYNFSLKGKTVPVQSILNKTNLKNLQVTGNGNVSISAQLEGKNFLLRNCELSVPNEGHIAYTPEVYPNPFLENLKDLGFKKLSVYLTEQDDKVDLIFSSDNKSNKLRKKTNFRFTIKEPLSKFIRSSVFKILDIVKDEKDAF